MMIYDAYRETPDKKLMDMVTLAGESTADAKDYVKQVFQEDKRFGNWHVYKRDDPHILLSVRIDNSGNKPMEGEIPCSERWLGNV